jgi:hypothetical protein
MRALAPIVRENSSTTRCASAVPILSLVTTTNRMPIISIKPVTKAPDMYSIRFIYLTQPFYMRALTHIKSSAKLQQNNQLCK